MKILNFPVKAAFDLISADSSCVLQVQIGSETELSLETASAVLIKEKTLVYFVHASSGDAAAMGIKDLWQDALLTGFVQRMITEQFGS